MPDIHPPDKSPTETLAQSRFFIDFDHTISQIDVWDTLVRKCNPDQWQSVIGDYVNGKKSSRQCNLELAQSIELTESEAHRMVSAIDLDPTFRDFVAWTQEQSFPILILSDGYDFYIDLLLKREKLDFIPVFSNKMVWTNEGIQVEFPLYREDCERDMAHCKCQHVRSANGFRRVYIGDGVSDTCAASKCDFVHAKLNLLDYCREHRLDHRPFENFQQILEFEQQRFNTIQENAESLRA